MVKQLSLTELSMQELQLVVGGTAQVTSGAASAKN